MNILYYDHYITSSQQTLISLVESGHTVYKNWQMDEEKQFDNSLGMLHIDQADAEIVNLWDETIEHKAELIKLTEDLIERYDIDVLKVDTPHHSSMLYDHFHKKIKYIGVSEEIYLLEKSKNHGRNLVESLGVSVPEIIKRGNYSDDDYGTNLSFPCVEKPYDEELSTKIFNNIDEMAVWKENKEPDTSHAYYIEEYFPDMVEAQVSYVIVGGEYYIKDICTISGLGKNKNINDNPWMAGTEYGTLDDNTERLVVEESDKILKEIVKLGGHWEGGFSLACTPDQKIHFLEHNVRPDLISCASDKIMTGDEYLRGIFEDISIFENAWADKNLQIISISNDDPTTPYPIDLHDKYGVTYPNHLVLRDDGEYYAYVLGNVRRTIDPLDGDGCISAVTVLCDRNIPSEFMQELEKTTWDIGAKD